MVMDAASFSHTSIVLLAGADGGTLVAERPRLRDRLAAHWHARRLDRVLADGVPPEAAVTLALRAQRLTEPDRRWSMAGSLRRIVRAADGDGGGRRRLARVTPNRPAVLRARDELGRLADTLDDPGPVAAQGVAQAWLLLTDGTGPLYNSRSTLPLGDQAARAASASRPWSL